MELALSKRNEHLLRRDVDSAVRMVRPTQAGLAARRAGAATLGFHARQDYLDAHGTPENLDGRTGMARHAPGRGTGRRRQK